MYFICQNPNPPKSGREEELSSQLSFSAHGSMNPQFSITYLLTYLYLFLRQHTLGVVGHIIWVLFRIYSSFHWWKNFENRFVIGKVIPISWVVHFLRTQCIDRWKARGRVPIGNRPNWTFSPPLTVKMLYAEVCRIRRFSKGWVTLSANLRRKSVSPTNY